MAAAAAATRCLHVLARTSRRICNSAMSPMTAWCGKRAVTTVRPLPACIGQWPGCRPLGGEAPAAGQVGQRRPIAGGVEPYHGSGTARRDPPKYRAHSSTGGFDLRRGCVWEHGRMQHGRVSHRNHTLRSLYAHRHGRLLRCRAVLCGRAGQTCAQGTCGLDTTGCSSCPADTYSSASG